MSTAKRNKINFEVKELSEANSLKISLVVSKWNTEITEALFHGAYSTLIQMGVKKTNINRIDVFGSFELIFGTKIAIKENPDAIITIGSIIQGQTKHFDFISRSVSSGIKDLNILYDIPIIFCVLTDNNYQQAIDRSGGKYGNKGIESAIAAVEMALL
jgi:6,7-dimethyl-8-ribityllumazine synthase